MGKFDQFVFYNVRVVFLADWVVCLHVQQPNHVTRAQVFLYFVKILMATFITVLV